MEENVSSNEAPTRASSSFISPNSLPQGGAIIVVQLDFFTGGLRYGLIPHPSDGNRVCGICLDVTLMVHKLALRG